MDMDIENQFNTSSKILT